jgi:tight adherence protein B
MNASAYVTISLVACAAAVLLLAWAVGRSMPALGRSQARSFQGQMHTALRAIAMPLDVRMLWVAHLLLVVLVAGLTAWLTASLLWVVVVTAVLGAIPRLVLQQLRKRYLNAIRAQLPDAMRLMAAGLQSGAALWTVLDLHARELPEPLRSEFEIMLREQRLGLSLDHSLSGLQTRCPLEDTRLLVAVLRMGYASGAGLGEALSGLAQTTRQRIDLENKMAALTAQGRLQAIVMACLPLALLGMLRLVDPPSAALLLDTSAGHLALFTALVLQTLGFLIIRRIVQVPI